MITVRRFTSFLLVCLLMLTLLPSALADTDDTLSFGCLDFTPEDFVAFQGIGFTSLKNAVETVAALETDSIVFQYDGATYIFAEESADVGEGYVNKYDMLIKLVGNYDLEDVVAAINVPV